MCAWALPPLWVAAMGLPCPALTSRPHLEVQLVQGGRQVLGHMTQEVAGQDEDLDVARTVKHVVRQSSVRQLVVVQIHRPGGRGTGPHPPRLPTPPLALLSGEPPNFDQVGPGAQDTLLPFEEPQTHLIQFPVYC